MLVKMCCILFYRLWGNGYKSVKVYQAEYLRSVYFTVYLYVYLLYIYMYIYMYTYTDMYMYILLYIYIHIMYIYIQ